jgi:hypothetical protein
LKASFLFIKKTVMKIPESVRLCYSKGFPRLCGEQSFASHPHHESAETKELPCTTT